MIVTVTQNAQGLFCAGTSSGPGGSAGATTQVRQDPASAVAGIITAAVYELASIDALIFRGVDLRPLFPPGEYQESPVTTSSRPPAAAIPGNPRLDQQFGPLVNRNGQGEMRLLPSDAHPCSRTWAALNPYMRPSPRTRLLMEDCTGFGNDSQRWRLIRWIQYVLPRIPQGSIHTSNVHILNTARVLEPETRLQSK